MIINKKAEIGETLTWVVAFVIIALVMIFFTFGSIAIGATKKIGNEIVDLNEGKGLQSQKELVKLLNTKVEFKGQVFSIADLIVLWDLNSGDEEEKAIMDNAKLILDMSSGEKGNYGVLISQEKGSRMIRLSKFPVGLTYVPDDPRTSKLSLYSSSSQINIILDFER